jgi:hypothetical protein
LLRLVVVVAVFALGGALAAVVAMYATALGTVPANHWNALAQVASLFAIFGAVLGTIMALDGSATPTPLPRWLSVPFNAPVLRTVICSALGACAVAVASSWQAEAFALVWFITGAAVGAVLGWAGWRWAKYVDF